MIFYRDIGFDLDFDYVKPYFAGVEFAGVHGCQVSTRSAATRWTSAFTTGARRCGRRTSTRGIFLRARVEQMEKLESIMDRPALDLAPYDAELFGHWWYEGPEFLNYFMRKAYYDQKAFTLTTPHEYLRHKPDAAGRDAGRVELGRGGLLAGLAQ